MSKNNTSSSSQSPGKQQKEWKISRIEVLELSPWQFFSQSSSADGKVRC